MVGALENRIRKSTSQDVLTVCFQPVLPIVSFLAILAEGHLRRPRLKSLLLVIGASGTAPPQESLHQTPELSPEGAAVGLSPLWGFEGCFATLRLWSRIDRLS